MKKIIILLLFITCLVGCEKKSVSTVPIKIGAILELTGNMSAVGLSAKNAAEMAVKEINDQGGLIIDRNNTPVQLIIEDSGKNVAQSVLAAHKLIQQDQVVAIVGPNVSADTIAVANVAEQEKTPMLAPWSTAMETTIDATTEEHKEYVFRVSFSDLYVGRVLANFARYTKNYKTVAILYEADSKVPANQASIFKNNFEKLGGKIVAFETYLASTKNFSAQLNRIKAANPDVLFLPDYYGNIPSIVQQARQLGIRAEFLGSDAWNHLELLPLAKGALEGAYFVSHYSPDDPSSVTQSFVKKYQQLYGKTPDDVAALTYDAYQLLFKAITKANSFNHQKIRNALVDLPLVEGVTGAIDYEERFSGEPQKSAVILQIQGNKFVWVAHANP